MIRKKFFFFSVVGHLLILVSALLYLQIKIRNDESTHSIPTYVYGIAAKASIQANSSPVNIEKKPSLPTEKLSLQKREEQHKLTQLQKSSRQSKASLAQIHQDNNPTQSKHHNTILQLLHNAIAEKQTYPEVAIELKQTGTVRIGFFLAPDGTLSNITVIQSSSFLSIDAAAINAVNAISPIKPAGRYLQQPEYFTVDVIFS